MIVSDDLNVRAYVTYPGRSKGSHLLLIPN